MQPVVTAGAGFLLAVLWFDLMFDTQTVGQSDAALPEPILASIGAYYRRATTEARPMNRLIAVVMFATLAGIVVQLVRDDVARWVSALSLASAVVPIGLAAVRTVPSAVRLGGRRDSPFDQSALARAIYRDHVFCLASVAVLLITQLVWG